MNSFIENVNYVANLDNKYGRSIEIFKNNLSLRTDNYNIDIKFTYYNNQTKELIDIITPYTNVSISSIESILLNFKSQIDGLIDGVTFNSYCSFSYTDFIINNTAIINLKINSLNDNIKVYGLNIKINLDATEIYNINGNLSDTLKILPSIATLTPNNIDAIVSFNDSKNDVITVSENIIDVITVSDNTSNINIVSSSILNVNTVSSNIDNINEVSLVSNDISIISAIPNEIKVVADNILNVNLSGDNILNVNTVGSNISNVNVVGNNISNVNTVGNNIVNINAVSTLIVPNISEILMVNDKTDQAFQYASDAQLSEFFSRKWAEEQEDVPVVGTIGVNDEYSAYHWAKKAEASSGGTIALNSLYDVDTTGIVDGGTIVWNKSLGQYVSYDLARNDVVGLDTTANYTVGVGQIAWNANEGTADLGLPGGSTLQIGQENTRTVRNGTASTIANGTVVMFAGTVGNSGRIKVAPYTGIKCTHKYIYGVATQTITSGSDGLITIDGKVRGINTTGSLVGEIWNDEDILYVKPNDSGRLTNVEPGAGELKIVVATVIHAHTNGTLEVRVLPIDENMSYTKEQSDNTFVPLVGDFTLDLGGL